MTISTFLSKFPQKVCIRSKTEKKKITIEFCIFELILVPKFSLN